MEEILASIRRIIEDSDGGRTDNAAAAPPLGTDEADADLATFRADLARDAGTTAPLPRATAELTPATDIPGRSPRLSFDAGRRHEPATPLPEIGAAPRPTQPSAASHSVFATVEPIEPEHEPAAAEETTTTEEGASRTGILSDAASRQVAASFGELSDAFSASRRRSFDEIAEEMLRPMLQDWLDNNLPTLVERLVREEIERVARGGSR